MAKVEKLRDQNLVSGSDIQSYQKLFDGLGRTGGDADREFAPQFSDALEGIMQNTTPYGRNLTPGQGMNLMTGGGLGGHGLAPGDMAAARNAGDKVFGRLQDVNRLQGWQDAAKVAGGPDVGAQARSYLLSDEGQRLAPLGTARHDAFNKLAATPVPPALSATPTTWDVRHVLSHVIEPVAFGIAGGGAGGVEGGGDLGHIAEGALTGAALGYGLHKGLPVVQNWARSGPYEAAQDAARVVASTGLPQAPIQPMTPLRDALRMLGVYGPGSGGAF